jgi:hypothetical protein
MPIVRPLLAQTLLPPSEFACRHKPLFGFRAYFAVPAKFNACPFSFGFAGEAMPTGWFVAGGSGGFLEQVEKAVLVVLEDAEAVQVVF